MRVASSAHRTLAAAPASIPTKKVPTPRAATSASAMLVRSGTRPAVCGSSSSREASTTPTTAATMPATWTAAGRAPPAEPAAPGTGGPGGGDGGGEPLVADPDGRGEAPSAQAPAG